LAYYPQVVVGFPTNEKIYPGNLPHFPRRFFCSAFRLEPVNKDGAKILAVDDEEPQRELLRRVLARFGYNVTTAADAIEALDVLEQTRFDLLITDYKMVRMDGVTFALRLRSRGLDMPIIFISGAPPEDLHDKVGNGSDVRFLQKPFGGRVLIEAIQTMLKPQPQSEEPVIQLESSQKIGLRRKLPD
jgi:CheY-like chemotaxis protein